MDKDLIIPVYVDTNALLDLLASIEGGFSTMEKVTTRSAEGSGIDRNVKADAGSEFGVPNVLSLLKLNLGYSANWKKSQEGSEQRESDRYHTYGSLFHRLREYLTANSLLKRLNEGGNVWADIAPSDFVEIRGVFRPNPFASSLEIMDRLIGIYKLFLNSSFPSQSSAGQADKRKSQEEKTRVQSEAKQIEQFKEFLRGVLQDIQSENIRAFVVDLNYPKDYRAVILLYLNYMRDQTTKELSHKEYRLLGKVVRKVEKESSEKIDLLLGTGLGGIGKQTLQGLVAMFNQVPNMNLPEIQTEINGPALEIVPVAIFV